MNTNEEKSYETLQQFYRDGISEIEKHMELDYVGNVGLQFCLELSKFLADNNAPGHVRGMYNFIFCVFYALENADADQESICKKIIESLQDIIETTETLNHKEGNIH